VEHVEGSTRNAQQDGGVTNIEASRRHGPFDPRRQKRPLHIAADRLTIALSALEDVPEGLDWDAFSTCYFPGRRRHDLEAISAYDAYQHGRRWRNSSRPKRTRSMGLNEPLLTTVGGAPRVRRASLSKVGATR
jgi:hypothetical protein